MKAEYRNGQLVLSEPASLGERVLLENINTLVTYGWGKTVEFNVTEVAKDSVTDYANSVSLKIVIPSEFEDDGTGDGGVVRKEERCPYCGGENH